MAVSKQPSITPETSSGEGLDEEPTARGEAKWKRFHPLRVVRKIFRRRAKRQDSGRGTTESSKKSWSTSELQSVQEPPEKYEVPSPPYKIGLSVSHDSIFSPETSNLVGTEELNRPPGSSLSVQHAGMKNMFKDELFSRVHARRDSDDDDIGLPHSPCTSPTTVDVLNQGLKAKPLKSGSLSVGSLISTGSSENDEDSAVASSSGNSSRMSLLDRRSLDFEVDLESYQPIPLNHNAAHHKIAVRPKRTHGLPQKRLKQQLAASRLINPLPTTPEVTEDNGKSCMKVEAIASGSKEEHTYMASITSVEKSTSKIKSEFSYESSASRIYSHKQENHFMEESISDNNAAVSQTIENIRESSLNQSSFNSQDVSSEKEVPLKIDILKNHRLSFSESASVPKDGISKEGIHTSHPEAVPKLPSSTKPDIDSNPAKTKNSNVEESALCVSDLIKSIERSDSVGKTKDGSIKVSGKPTSAKCDLTAGTKHIQMNESEIQTEAQKIINSGNDSPAIPPKLESQVTSHMGTFDSIAQKEISLSPIQLQMEIRQQFQQQKGVKEQQQSHRITRTSQEEESIMSNKSLIMPQPNAHHRESESNHVTVSHQITESHNLVTVDKSFKRNNVHTSNSENSAPKPKESRPHSINAPQDSNVSNLMVNSAHSFEQKVKEDKVTISICSKSGDDHINNLSNKGYPLHHSNEVKDDKSTEKKDDLTTKQPDVSKPLLKDKAALFSKNANSSKRVSVEIVPFNQRMKDEKYQPLSYMQKPADKSKELEKDISNPGTVERNLSERRSSGKLKDAEKANNRHSFSGPLSTDSEKPCPSEKKPILKTEKVHYPVQIRIHKSKTYEKENHFEKAKARKSQSPEPSSDKKHNLHPVKVISDNKNNLENHSNWEVKVHSTSLPRKDAHDTTTPNNSKPNNVTGYSTSANEVAPACQQQDEKKAKTSNSTNSSAVKNLENTRKSTKSGDPEPELFRVFARRSIKQKHNDKDKSQEQKKVVDSPILTDETPPSNNNNNIHDETNASTPPPPPAQEAEVQKPQKNTTKSPEVVKRKSKSFNEKEKLSTFPLVTPLKEVGLNRRQSLKIQSPETGEPDNFHRRQRIASEPDVLPVFPPIGDNTNGSLHVQHNLGIESVALTCRSQSLSISSSPTLSNGTSSLLGLDTLKNKDNQDKDGPAPSWLQLAQQRREMREQRERLLIGSSTNTFLDASNKPSRSSKVWDMVNNFQKLQMT